MTTNTIEKGQGAPSTLTPMTNTNNADSRSHGPIQQAHNGKTAITRLAAAYSHIKDAVGGFYIQRGVGIEAIGAVILVAVFALVRVFQ